jgi:hypothetical protein
MSFRSVNHDCAGLALKAIIESGFDSDGLLFKPFTLTGLVGVGTALIYSISGYQEIYLFLTFHLFYLDKLQVFAFLDKLPL